MTAYVTNEGRGHTITVIDTDDNLLIKKTKTSKNFHAHYTHTHTHLHTQTHTHTLTHTHTHTHTHNARVYIPSQKVKNVPMF